MGHHRPVGLATFIVYVALGLLLDWGLYSRTVISLGSPGFDGSGDGYARLLFPRVVLTLASITALFFAGTGKDMNVALFIGGAGVFLISSFYAAYRFLSGR